MKNQTAQIWLIAVTSLYLFMKLTPSIPQPQMYHDFADKRQFFGIPNALNVISNFPFMVIGLIGLMLCHRRNYFNFSVQGELWGWTCFYAAVTSVGFGSSYYHLGPNDNGLVCDRLPMTVAFASLVAILIIERIDANKGTISIFPLIMIAMISRLFMIMPEVRLALLNLVAPSDELISIIMDWLRKMSIVRAAPMRFFGDIRPYLLVQTVSCIAIPLMAFLLPPMYTHSTYWLWAAGFYPLAMLQETADRLIYTATFHTVSGHTLKHLSAGMVPLILTIMLAKRRLLHAKSA
ncbi:hypothetical protein L195_g006684 [Trifolium pratense]|uniref:Alkaline phytoceramidase n=1 Tax=Trifolium pratense TaxID=57577 RepID=A0A2K3P491_TRIPR|nr:hypothetical protein L195_g006684 [Trifolium pratense]